MADGDPPMPPPPVMPTWRGDMVMPPPPVRVTAMSPPPWVVASNAPTQDVSDGDPHAAPARINETADEPPRKNRQLGPSRSPVAVQGTLAALRWSADPSFGGASETRCGGSSERVPGGPPRQRRARAGKRVRARVRRRSTQERTSRRLKRGRTGVAART